MLNNTLYILLFMVCSTTAGISQEEIRYVPGKQYAAMILLDNGDQRMGRILYTNDFALQHEVRFYDMTDPEKEIVFQAHTLNSYRFGKRNYKVVNHDPGKLEDGPAQIGLMVKEKACIST